VSDHLSIIPDISDSRVASHTLTATDSIDCTLHHNTVELQLAYAPDAIITDTRHYVY